MIEVKVRDPESKESFNRALKKFTRQCNRDGFLKEARDRMYFKSPSQKRREKRARSIREIARRQK
jgi:ribosomal protein S21